MNVIFTISTLPARYCLAVALAFLHPSLGSQKATLGSFSMDGFGGLGLNPAGVSLFRMHVERCLSGLLRSIQARRKLLVHGRPPPGFPVIFKQFRRCLLGECHFNNFDAACQVMSGSCVGFSSSFFRVSESDVRHFFDGWFWRVRLESCWAFPVSDAC